MPLPQVPLLCDVKREIGMAYGACGFPLLCRLEQIFRHDGQVGHALGHPGALRVWPDHALSRRGVLRHHNLVPDELSRIKRIKQQAIATFAVAVDGRGIPASSARRRDALGIERLGNLARGRARDVVLEDPAHDRGLRLIDAPRATLEIAMAVGLGRQHVIAVGTPAGRTAFVYPRAHAAAGVVLQVFQLLTVDYGADAIDQRRDHAVGRGGYGDAVKAEALSDRGAILLVAADAAHGFG